MASQSARRRHDSRTPRSKIRAPALSPENGNRGNHAKFTPNGTKVPDGPPPPDDAGWSTWWGEQFV